MPKREIVTSWDSVPVIMDIGYVAALLKLTTETTRKLCVNGGIPAFKVGDLWRISKAELMKMCQSGGKTE